MKSLLCISGLLLMFSACNSGSKSTSSDASSSPQNAELKAADTGAASTASPDVGGAMSASLDLATASASDQCIQKGSDWSWDATTQVCNQVLNAVSATQQCTALGGGWIWDPSQKACTAAFTSISAKVQCEKNVGMKWSVADNACEQSYSTRLAQDECTSKSNSNGGSFLFATSTDSTGAVQYLCYEYASSDATDAQSTTQAACSAAHSSDDTWVFAGGKCFQFAKQETGAQYCEDKGIGWAVVNGVCTQAAILTADQCNAKTNTKWDVVSSQCVQYIALDTNVVDAPTCKSSHASDAAATWIWITTEKNPTAGVCAETLLLTTTAAQCTALIPSGWVYDTTTTPPRCIQTMAQYTSQSQCTDAGATYKWDEGTKKCVENVSMTSPVWATLKTQCTSIPGYYWIATTPGSTTDFSGVCKNANMLSTSIPSGGTTSECAANSGVSMYANSPILLQVNQTQGCITKNTGELLCRFSGFSWNYATMSCQYCSNPTQDLVGWDINRNPICQSPPYISIGIGYYHSCAVVRKIVSGLAGYPNVQCWGGGAPGSSSWTPPSGESYTDATEARTLRTAKTGVSATRVGHVVPPSDSSPESIPFVSTISNHVKLTSPITSMAVGAYATCAIIENSLQCWGRSDFVGGAQGSNTVQWINAVNDLTPNNANLLLKKVVVSKTDPTVEKDKEVFCLLADDYTNSPPSSAVYCWGNLKGTGILPLNSSSSSLPVLIQSGTSSLPASILVYGNIYTSQSNTCVMTVGGGATYCWGATASTSLQTRTLPSGTTSYSGSEYISCYLQSKYPYCSGLLGVDTGNFNQVSAGSFAQPYWDPTSLVVAAGASNTITNLFAYDIPENPQTMSFTSSLTATGTTAQTFTGQALGVQYTQTYTGVQTQTKSGTTTGNVSTNPVTNTISTSARSINSYPLVTPQLPGGNVPAGGTPITFTSVVTLRNSACGLDNNGNVWCWGSCTYNTTNSSVIYPGGPSIYCRNNSSTAAGIAVGSTTGRFTPTRVAWAAFLADPSGGATMTAPYRKILATPISVSENSTAGGKLNVSTPYLDHVTGLFAGVYGVCAVRDVGSSSPLEVFCWGNNAFGTLGDGTTNSTTEGTLSPSTLFSGTTNTAIGSSTATATATSVSTSGVITTTTFSVTATTTWSETLNAPTLTLTPGSFIGQPVFILNKQ